MSKLAAEKWLVAMSVLVSVCSEQAHCCSFLKALVLRTSDGGNGNHSVSLPIILIKIEVNQMLPSSYISSVLVSFL